MKCCFAPAFTPGWLRRRMQGNAQNAGRMAPIAERSSAPANNNNSGPPTCLLTSTQSKEERVDRMMETLVQNSEGLMYVKLPMASPQQQSPIIVYIRWTTNLSPNYLAADFLFKHSHFSEPSPPESEESESSKSFLDESPLTQISIHSNPSSKSCSVELPEDNFARSDKHRHTCILCMERVADFQLLPCTHKSFCRRCIAETVCRWNKPWAPNCPMCRAPFTTMVYLM
mmetsp:Transcript_41298/g.110408  ORF Transcript_41298/g.110408 Transcript_41298/m.110408 type:complete len:228 (+) Transcript_41298:59-742(+)